MRKFAGKCMKGFFGGCNSKLLAVAGSLIIKTGKMANTPAGLLLLGSASAFFLLPRLGQVLNPVDEYQFGYGIVSFTMKAPAKDANLYHFYVPATGATEVTENPRKWSPWTKTGISVQEKDCFMLKASGSVHTSIKRLFSEIDNPAVSSVLSPRYVGPNGTTEIEETPYQSRLRKYRIYRGSDIGFGGLAYRIASKE